MIVNIIESFNASLQLPVPKKPGLYAILLKSFLPGFANPGQWIYLGKAEENLAGRDLNTHFRSGKTGSSTLRRSIGAILKDELQLRAIPRGKGNSTNEYTHYKFADDGEERLTDWIRDLKEYRRYFIGGVKATLRFRFENKTKKPLCRETYES